MPSALTYPGVYIEEISSGVHTIVGVATSTAAFVGYTVKGDVNSAVLCTSFADFERTHGGLDRDSPVSYAVRQFFANGGVQAYVVRVAAGLTTSHWTLKDGAGQSVLEIDASSPGAWANNLRVSVDVADVQNPDTDFKLVVSQTVPGEPDSVLEVFRNLSLDNRSAQFVESVVNSTSRFIRVTRSSGLVFNKAGIAVSKQLAFPINASDRVIAGIVDGKTAFRFELPAPLPTTVPLLVTAIQTAISGAGYGALLTATQSKDDGQNGTGAVRLASQTANESSSVVIAEGAFGGLARAIGMGLANGGREFTGSAQIRPAAISNVVPSVGKDGSKGGATELVGFEKDRSGIYALLGIDLFNLLSIPETFDLPEDVARAVVGPAQKLCQDRRAFYIIDVPASVYINLPLERKLPAVVAWTQNGVQSNYAATYYPAVRIADPLDQFRPRAMAPSGTLAGVYARTDSERGVWKAPAGTEATLNGTDSLTALLSDIENGTINIRGVNALRSFPTYGRVAWGARTMKGDDNQPPEWKYIPVRRLALFLEESLYRGTQWVVFEPNDEPLWAQIRLNVGAFMNDLFRQGAFQGQTPREAYFVKCDKDTTTQNDINKGIVNILVGFAPLKPAEFVVVKLQQIAGQIQT